MLSRGVLAFAFAVAAGAQPAVTTAQYDNARTGANLAETVLTPRNVNEKSFGKHFVIPLDGAAFAQPLYVPRLDIPGKGTHNVVFVATEHNSVYAIDAAGAPTEPLWRVNFGTPVAAHDVRCSFIPDEVGITPTPAIDLPSRTMYVLARTTERNRDGRDAFFQRLHAIDITTGAERPGSPVLIRAGVKAKSWFGLGGGDIGFNALLENPRAAMLLASGNVYIAFGSACDAMPYFGWVLSYDARTLRQTGVLNVAPEAHEGGIWQADAGIAADAAGNVYAVTGNGSFTAAKGGRDFGDSVLRIGFDKGVLAIRDYFTPFDESRLNSKDQDLGSGGPVLLPDQPGPHPHVLVTAGKAGKIYVIDRDRMGGFHAGSDSHAIQTLPGGGTDAFGAPAYWNGHLYYWVSNDVLKDYAVDNGRLSASPVHQGTFKFKDPGAIPVVSANGNKDGVVWAVISKGWRDYDRYGKLQAYDAADVSRKLTEVETGTTLRFSMPLVVDGRVYVACKNALYAYGLNPPSKSGRGR